MTEPILIFGLDSGAWFSIGIFCGYLALLVAFVWKIDHCKCCSKRASRSHRTHK